MEPIQASFLIVKAEDTIWDVLIFSEDAVLEAFSSIYDAHYVAQSVFEKRPMAVIPDFPDKRHAEVWKEYWIEALRDPDNACKSCTTVNQFFEIIEEVRQGK